MENKYLSTAAAYIRVSTEDQIEFSPDSQRKRIQEYADRNRIRLLEQYIFIDEGISGRSADNRPAFLNMIRTAGQTPKPFDQILLWKFSRFARNRQDSIFYKSMLRREYGIDVISITEQLSDDPTSILIEALLEAMDEYYSINLAQEVRRGMNEKFSRGGIVCPPPFGYRTGNERYDPDPSTAPFIPMIFSDFLQGMSCRQIAEKLNQMAVSTVRGNAFEARSIRYILGNPVYLGMQRRRLSGPYPESPMSVVPALHPPLISEEVFRSAQELLRLTQKKHGSQFGGTASSFMLRGLVRCSLCGATLTRTQKGETLQCCRYTRGQCSQSHSISLSVINKAVLQKLSEDLSLLPVRRITFTLPAKEQKKDRKYIPASGLSTTIDFSELPVLLCSPLLSEAEKNEILQSLISKILFSRKDGTIRIYYRSPCTN